MSDLGGKSKALALMLLASTTQTTSFLSRRHSSIIVVPSRHHSSVRKEGYLRKKSVILNENKGHRQTNDDSLALDSDSFWLERFQRRKQARSRAIENERLRRPPYNPELVDPQQVISSLLEGLQNNHDPAPYFGMEQLWLASTLNWRRTLLRSMGMDASSILSVVSLPALAKSLTSVMARPNQQFEVLFQEYALEFPMDALELEPGNCWVEARVRDPVTHELWAVLGWTLVQQIPHENESEDDITAKISVSDKTWNIESLEWQDFRDDYRPGIGRDEWERICG